MPTWVFDHHYLRLHEISREKTSQGKPQYEARIYIAWNEAPKQYAAIWLDVYGGVSAESIGIAAPKENATAALIAPSFAKPENTLRQPQQA